MGLETLMGCFSKHLFWYHRDGKDVLVEVVSHNCFFLAKTEIMLKIYVSLCLDFLS